MGKFLAILPIVLLSGCAVPVVVSVVTGAASVAVNETTGRTVTDHAVSAAYGQDCRVGRALKQEDVCQHNQTVKLNVTTTGVTPSTVQEIQARYR